MNVLELVENLRTVEESLGKETPLFSFIGDSSDPNLQPIVAYRVTGRIHKESHAQILEVSFQETENEVIDIGTLIDVLEERLDEIPLNAPVMFTVEDMSRVITWKKLSGGTHKDTEKPAVFFEFFEEDSAVNIFTKMELKAHLDGVDLVKELTDALFENHSD